MQILPILSTLRRHRTAATLIVLQIAVTCAIVCNAIFLIGERIDRLDLPSGIVEDELVRIELSAIGKDDREEEHTAADLAALAALPGVESVAASNMVPMVNNSWNSSISRIADDPDAPINAAMYIGSPDFIETFGVRLVAGRDFGPDEYVGIEDTIANRAHPPTVIITRGVAERLFPGENPLGQTLYGMGEQPQTVVGVIEHLARPTAWQGRDDDAYAMLYPILPTYRNYVLRVDPARKAEVLAAASAALIAVYPTRLQLDKSTFGELRAKFFEQDRAMAWLLGFVCVGLLVITALGIVGLASFWVQQRTRQIGIRRALGASRADILSYFHTENFILATLGILLGMVLAYGINHGLMDAYQVPRLPGYFLPAGAILLWTLGQLAVFGPAVRASAVPPAVATRSV